MYVHNFSRKAYYVQINFLMRKCVCALHNKKKLCTTMEFSVQLETAEFLVQEFGIF